MKFSIGDRILLKRTGEEGHVVAIINDNMFEVEVNGTIFPAYKDEIDHPYLKWFTEKNTQQKKQAPPEQLPVERLSERQQKLAKGIYLSFIPVYRLEEMEDVVDHLKIYLLNELPIPVKFSYDVRFLHNSEFAHAGTLHEFGSLYLHNVPYADMNDQPRFHWQLTHTTDEKMAVAEGILRIRPQKLFEHISELQLKNEPSFSYLLIEDFSEKKKEEKPEPFIPAPKTNIITTSNAGKKLEAPRYEIDLHIEHLTDPKGLNNAEMLNIQLTTLQHYLQLALAHRQERMTIIHGLGKGVLRDEVHKILKQTKHVARYKNEWHGRYGFGATEVYFRY